MNIIWEEKENVWRRVQKLHCKFAFLKYIKPQKQIRKNFSLEVTFTKLFSRSSQKNCSLKNIITNLQLTLATVLLYKYTIQNWDQKLHMHISKIKFQLFQKQGYYIYVICIQIVASCIIQVSCNKKLLLLLQKKQGSRFF